RDVTQRMTNNRGDRCRVAIVGLTPKKLTHLRRKISRSSRIDTLLSKSIEPALLHPIATLMLLGNLFRSQGAHQDTVCICPGERGDTIWVVQGVSQRQPRPKTLPADMPP